LAYPTINGQVGTSLSTAPTQLLRTGTATISAGQPLPAGLSLNASSGVISGVPQNPGTSTIPLSISDASGTGSALVTIVIAPQATTTTTTTTTTPPPPPPQGPPQITALAVSPRRFHPGARPTAITARKHGVTGTTITASVSEPATVTFRIAAVRATCTGHGRHKHCSKRYTGSLTRTSIGGPIRIAFSGRVGRHVLARGSYVLTATATGPDGRRGAPRSTRFTVL
jgi:hypothetical protein